MRGWPVAAAGMTALALPSALSIGPVRAALTPALAPPRLSGISDAHHVALTFDDGPDPASTPLFLDLLDRLGVRATFFLLGRHVAGNEDLVRRTADAGHELGVHGWDHRPVVLHGPRALREGIVRTRGLLEGLAGRPVRWYRPPYGLLTPASWYAARAAGLDTVLWSAWGRDWSRQATHASVFRLVMRDARPGGTVLLHDSDRTSAPASWRSTLVATGLLVSAWREQGIGVGPLAEHWDGARLAAPHPA